MLHEIQKSLKAPKSQRNTFWNYNYRSTEDIMEAVKPLLWDATLTISDEMVEVWGRVYVKATATYKSKDETVTTTAYAREPETKKGMDDAQITWATSSYARKYALNGLFAIDDTKDSDATNKHEKQTKEITEFQKQWLNYDDLIAIINAGNITWEAIKKIVVEDGYKMSKKAQEAIQYFLETGDVGKDLKSKFFTQPN